MATENGYQSYGYCELLAKDKATGLKRDHFVDIHNRIQSKQQSKQR